MPDLIEKLIAAGFSRAQAELAARYSAPEALEPVEPAPPEPGRTRLIDPAEDPFTGPSPAELVGRPTKVAPPQLWRVDPSFATEWCHAADRIPGTHDADLTRLRPRVLLAVRSREDGEIRVFALHPENATALIDGLKFALAASLEPPIYKPDSSAAPAVEATPGATVAPITTERE